MEYTLTGYQTDAVRCVLASMSRAQQALANSFPSSFGLTAPTGAGKTVIAAAVIEALFFGDEQNRFDADEKAVVLWFSQDPVLNKQTRHRIGEASDLVTGNRMVIIENTFVAEKFDAGKVYFINTGKFSKHSTLVRGHGVEDTGDELPGLDRKARPDARRYTIWDTIRNTINDPDRRLYLFVDEAHQGMGGNRSKADRDDQPTVIRRLINGHSDVPPVPIVFGISATIERFQDVIEGAKNRMPLDDVEVDRQAVLDSGLVKDDVVLTGVDEEGKYETVLLRRGVQRLREMTEAWDSYTSAQGDRHVTPLMVLQVPNTPTKESQTGTWTKNVTSWVKTVLEEWPALQPENFAHVFGDHGDLAVGDLVIPYVSPEEVQDTTKVRVLLAKDAISTGWDCPRAEVMVSFRSVKEPITITQLLGRLVRSPLQRRIDGHGMLNAVFCALPEFDKETVEKVVELITQGIDGEDPLPVGRVLTDAVDVGRNPKLDEQLGSEKVDEIFQVLADLPSEHAPSRSLRPIPRFLALAKELSRDELVEDGVKVSAGLINKEIEALTIKNDEAIEAAIRDIENVDLIEVTAQMGGTLDDMKTEKDTVQADAKTLNDAFSVASRSLGASTATSHVSYLLEKLPEPERIPALASIRTRVAAIGRQPDLVAELEGAAEKLVAKWLDQYEADIAMLPPGREQKYTDIKIQSKEIQTSSIGAVVDAQEPTMIQEGDKEKVPIDTFSDHVLAMKNGRYPWQAYKPEKFVLATEQKRNGFLAWYRNPSRGVKEALRIVYERGDRYGHMHPDFVFFFDKAGAVVPVIVDPHGSQHSDSMPKLVGLARFAEEHAEAFPRIEAVTDMGGGHVYLNLKSAEVREAIRNSDDAELLFKSKHAKKYGQGTQGSGL